MQYVLTANKVETIYIIRIKAIDNLLSIYLLTYYKFMSKRCTKNIIFQLSLDIVNTKHIACPYFSINNCFSNSFKFIIILIS